MNSMDGTQSSDNESLKGDMSYLFGRDPSILAYGQRPFPSQEAKKNLISLLEEKSNEDETINCEEQKVSTGTLDLTTTQTIKVYLRLKPFPRKALITPEQAEAYTIINSTTLLTKLPSLDTNASYLKKVKTNDKVCRKFIFSQTFGPETTQLELFEQAVKPQMIEFLAGKSSVIMSYGTTDSGKTFTLQGNAKFPGIIPRGIEYVFSNIDPRPTPPYKPINLCDVIYLNQQDRFQENDQKLKLLAFFNPVDRTTCVQTYEQIQRQLQEESPMKSNQNIDAHYSVWISFAEIYNENIYDLLSNDCQKKRPALKLGCDSRGRAFIKGLKSISVNSGAEAYQVLMVGQYNLKVAATALNSKSSRSHCIFIIKLLKYRNDNDPNSVVVSTFTFCDLAGTERLKKTLNVGERLKEAQNINTSLLVLGRCLKTIYESQNCTKSKNVPIGPFRESKLTKLFQRALSGKEQIALIVNVNRMPNLYDETQNVLNFSAIAKKIEIERHEPVKRRRSNNTRFSRIVTQSMKTEMDWDNTELDDDVAKESEEELEECELEEDDDEVLEELLAENEMLKNEIKDLKASALAKELKTRNEMSDMYSEIMKKIEADWKNRLDNMEEAQEDLRELAIERVEIYYKEKLSQLKFRKRSRSSRSLECEDEDDDKDLIEEIEIENARLLAKIETLEKSIKSLKEKKEAAESAKTKISFELIVAQQEAKRANEMLSAAEKSIAGDDASANYIAELNNKIKQKEERIKTFKVFLDEAKEEYISITNQAETMENRIKEQDELIAEYTERIRDLEDQLVQSNMYFSEQSKLIEHMEEELDQKTKKLITAEEKIASLTEQLNATNSPKSDKFEDVQSDVITNEERERNKLLLEEMKLKFQFADEENKLLKQKLNQRVTEIAELKSNLDCTKDQLSKITEKVNSLNIDEEEEDEKIAIITTEREIQTDTIDKSSTTELERKSIANTSCQTIEVQSPSIETEEKSLQTSLCLSNSPVKHIKKETIDLDVFNELQKEFDEIKEALEMCALQKEEAEKDFERRKEDLSTDLKALTLREEEKNERIECLQKELKEVVTNFEEEKKNLQTLIDAQESKDQYLTDQMTTILIREKDKEKEIITLQREMKNLIKDHEETMKRMESEMKVSLKELTVTKEELDRVEEKSKKVEKDYMQVIHILERKIDASEQKMLEKQTENDKLSFTVEELKKSLDDARMELESYKKNRNDMVSKYEDLVKSQRDEIHRLQREIESMQDALQEVKENTRTTSVTKSTRKTRLNLREEKKKAKHISSDATENTSDDDHHEYTQALKPKSKKEFLTATKDNIPVIELSGSDTKKATKNVSSESIASSTSSTRKTRKKKLFTQVDESFVEIEQEEPSPCPTTRSLRNRRK